MTPELKADIAVVRSLRGNCGKSNTDDAIDRVCAAAETAEAEALNYKALHADAVHNHGVMQARVKELEAELTAWRKGELVNVELADRTAKRNAEQSDLARRQRDAEVLRWAANNLGHEGVQGEVIVPPYVLTRTAAAVERGEVSVP